MIFNKKSMAEVIGASTGCTKEVAKIAADDLTKAMIIALINGDSIEIPNFGKFETVIKKERKVNNVYTKAIMDVPAGRYLRFRPSIRLKNAIKNKTE